MVTILLYGHLAQQFGKRHQFDIATPAEAIRAMSANFKAFKASIMQDGRAAYKIVAGTENRSDEQALQLPVGQSNTIKIIPIVMGSSGLGRVILGAALIAASFYFPYASATLKFGLYSSSISLAGVASSIGFSLVLGGVSQMLFAAPKSQSTTTERPDNKPSYAFSGAVNTVGQGNPVPYFFGGPLRIGSQVISAGLVTENI
jgi:predicted phage tail protein